jgi:hypothetical protein
MLNFLTLPFPKEDFGFTDGFPKRGDHHCADNHGDTDEEKAIKSDQSYENHQDHELGIEDIAPWGKVRKFLFQDHLAGPGSSIFRIRRSFAGFIPFFLMATGAKEPSAEI